MKKVKVQTEKEQLLAIIGCVVLSCSVSVVFCGAFYSDVYIKELTMGAESKVKW